MTAHPIGEGRPRIGRRHAHARHGHDDGAGPVDGRARRGRSIVNDCTASGAFETQPAAHTAASASAFRMTTRTGMLTFLLLLEAWRRRRRPAEQEAGRISLQLVEDLVQALGCLASPRQRVVEGAHVDGPEPVEEHGEAGVEVVDQPVGVLPHAPELHALERRPRVADETFDLADGGRRFGQHAHGSRRDALHVELGDPVERLGGRGQRLVETLHDPLNVELRRF